MKDRLTFPYPEKERPNTRKEVEKAINDSLPYTGDTPFERATGCMTFPLKTSTLDEKLKETEQQLKRRK